jgi:Trypsin-co-occurring domain 1
MDGGQAGVKAVTVLLPSGAPILVEAHGATSDDGMASVGLRDLAIGGALDTVRELGSLVADKLKAAKANRVAVELNIAFAAEGGKLTSLIVNGRGAASLTVTLEWSDPGRAGGPDA